ncbi:MAG: hypothetical protein BWX47_02073 [candidate division Hyd24-12 bacterium ADurb.Bin004]|nr:MAG: hypothetical protein BWX47_02073 [candidate division Hyd24-12 bacterium ADurb.Bin004]
MPASLLRRTSRFRLCSAISCSVFCSLPSRDSTSSGPMLPDIRLSSSVANSVCLSAVSLKPKPNSAASSKRLLFQAGPLPSAFTQ